MKQGLRINAARSEESRTEDWFPGQLVMRRYPKTFTIGTDFCFGPYLFDSLPGNGSVRIIFTDGQTIPVNHRNLKGFIPKTASDVEEKKLDFPKDLELPESKDPLNQDATMREERYR